MSSQFDTATFPGRPAVAIPECVYGGRFCPPATLDDPDGPFCSDYCRSMHRQSELPMWRRSVSR